MSSFVFLCTFFDHDKFSKLPFWFISACSNGKNDVLANKYISQPLGHNCWVTTSWEGPRSINFIRSPHVSLTHPQVWEPQHHIVLSPYGDCNLGKWTFLFSYKVWEKRWPYPYLLERESRCKAIVCPIINSIFLHSQNDLSLDYKWSFWHVCLLVCNDDYII